ncbi:MAG: hypothetical protein DWQ02_23440 [Bacteroidetes bacterium]|nr:MAG: hypothetical protein DWQ02_23440 [Bacteroidota bacterium]
MEKNEQGNNEKFPEIAPGQFALLQCEFTTGIVLNREGKYLTRHKDESYIVFDSFSDTLEFINNRQFKNIEYWIYDFKGELKHEKSVPPD